MNWPKTFYIKDKNLHLWAKHKNSIRDKLKACWDNEWKRLEQQELKGEDYNKEVADDKQEKNFD